MKTTKFAYYLHKYFTVELPGTRGSTPATIDSYRYAFVMFLGFMEEQGVPADRIEITDLTRKNVLGFLDWLQSSRGNSASTRNQRQAAINTFTKYLMYEFPDNLLDYQEILAIPMKASPKKEVSYLKTEGVKLLFDQVDTTTKSGIRDFAILTLFYTTGIRVSELVNIKVRDISLSDPPTLLVYGKGQKSRYVPLVAQAVNAINNHIDSVNVSGNNNLQKWLFENHMNIQLTRQGVNYIINKYADKARCQNPGIIPESVSPHTWRHTAAMELVDSDVALIYIRDLLGHASVRSTEIYIKADEAKKRKAIEAASREIVPPEAAQWEESSSLREWLKHFNRR